MGKKFRFEVEVEVSKTEGKSVSDEELEDAIKSELDDSQPGSVYVDDSEYSVDTFVVSSLTMSK